MRSKEIANKEKEEHYDLSIDSFIERLKKIRALNCNPIDVGIDNYLCKRLFSGKSNSLTKFI